MNITQRDRHKLFTQLQSAIGEPAAGSLMELLPLHPNSELATRADMAALTTTVRGELSGFRGELSEVRGEIAELRGEMHTGFADLRTELKGDIVSLEGRMSQFEGRLSHEVGRLYRWGAAVVTANAVTTITVLLAG